MTKRTDTGRRGTTGITLFSGVPFPVSGAGLKSATSRLVLLLELLLVVVLAFFAAKAFWLVSEGATPPEVTAIGTASRMADRPALPGTTIIGSFDPFYRNAGLLAAAVEEEVASEDEAAPETTLNLKLMGTRFNIDDARDSSNTAIIQQPNGQQKSFRVGGDILSNVSLTSVYPTYITITRAGVLERLSLDGAEEAQERLLVARSGNRPTTTGSAPAPQVAAASPASGITAGSQGPIANQNADIQLSRNDIEALFGSVILTPKTEGRRVTGWEMSAQGGSGVFEELGLLDGDILKSVNGFELRSAERLTEIPERLNGATKVTMVIERNGRDQQVSFAYDG